MERSEQHCREEIVAVTISTSIWATLPEKVRKAVLDQIQLRFKETKQLADQIDPEGKRNTEWRNLANGLQAALKELQNVQKDNNLSD